MEGQEKSEKQKAAYRTRGKAGEVAVMPAKYAVITHPDYRHAISFAQDGKAYLQPLADNEKWKVHAGKLFVGNLPASASLIKDSCTDVVPSGMDLTLLRLLYSIRWTAYESGLKAGIQPPAEMKIYLPDLLAFTGKATVSRNEAVSIVAGMQSCRTVMGVIDGGIFPSLICGEPDWDTHTISFASPYMDRLVKDVYDARYKVDSNGKKLIDSNGKPKTDAVHTYLIKPGIRNERNKRAVEIVHIVTVVIARAGNGLPHIKASTIVERDTLLRDALAGASPADRNKTLQRSFTRAWELLRTQTRLEETYSGIELPDPADRKNIPTMSQLDQTVFEFRHKGKNRSAEQAQS